MTTWDSARNVEWRERAEAEKHQFREGLAYGVLIGVGVVIFGWWVS